eukprot:scpid20509/ scgid35033/ 
MASIVRSELVDVLGTTPANALDLSRTEGPNKIFSVNGESREFHVNYSEQGVAYGETEKTSVSVVHAVKLSGGERRIAAYSLSVAPVERWGINFPGVLQLTVAGSDAADSSQIYLPGVRMYDPTGRTGDAHASERVGPSCAAFQTAVTVIELAAAYHGASLQELREVHESFRSCVVRYHGRVGLFDWMFQQIEDVVYSKKAVTPFSDFARAMVDEGKLDGSSDESEHTMVYLSKLVAPPAYYRKVKAKDNVDDVVRPEDRAKFDSFL